MFERYIVDSLLEDDNDDLQDGGAWVSAVRSKAQSCSSLSAVELAQLGEQAGFRVEVSWARQWSQDGALDAVFHRHAPNKNGARVRVNFPTDDHIQPASPLTNRPLQRVANYKTEAEVLEYLRSLLPAYMVPAQIKMLDRLPVNNNGKVDRKVLQRLARTAPKTRGPSTRKPPRNEIEAALCDEFASILGVEVGITDNFFDFGGHSLLATKAAARISRRLETSVSVGDIFDQPVIIDLAAVIQKGSSQHKPIPQAAYSGPVEQSYAQSRLYFLTSSILVPHGISSQSRCDYAVA